MDLKNLLTFKTVVTQGSFSKAAEALSYTQSTITFQMQQLEQELRTRLFEKIGRKMVLTQVGRQLIPYVDEVLSAVEKLSDFDASLSDLSGTLRIAAGESLLCYRLPPVLKTGYCRHLRKSNSQASSLCPLILPLIAWFCI